MSLCLPSTTDETAVAASEPSIVRTWTAVQDIERAVSETAISATSVSDVAILFPWCRSQSRLGIFLAMFFTRSSKDSPES